MISISKKEWKFVAIVSLITIFFTFLPIIIGWLLTPGDSTFLFRSYLNGVDYPFHFSYIEQVKAGRWLFENLFTSEKDQILFFNPFWLLIGIFARIFNLPAGIAFHLSRLFLTPVLLITLYYFIAVFFKEDIKRKACFIILVFYSGIFRVLGQTDAFPMITIYNFPHIIASLCLLILILLFSVLAFEKYKLSYSLWGGLFTLLLFSFHPYHVYTIFSVLSVLLLVDAIKNKKINVDYIKHYCIIILFSLPPVIYYLWSLKHNYIIYQWFLQNITLTPNLLIVLLNYSFLIPLSLLGIYAAFKKGNLEKQETFLIIWFFVSFFLIYLPVKTQNRLFQGQGVAIAILAACGLFYIDNFFKKKNRHYQSILSLNKLIVIYLVIIFSFFNLVIFASDLYLYFHKYTSFYIQKSQVEAMVWLRNNTKDNSIIFSSRYSDGLIPFFSLRKVFIGHHHGTINFAEKKLESEGFIKEQDSNKRNEFLRSNEINYLYFGPEEREKFIFNPDEDKYLEKVYNNNLVSIYKVK